MNASKLYHMEHFDKFNNIYTLYKKHIITYKRVTDEDGETEITENTNEKQKYTVFSDFYKYVPIYGHYYNDNNYFICKKIDRKKIREENNPHNFLIIKNEELVRPYKGGIYIAKNIDDLYNIIDRLNNYKIKQNEES
jgi:hypothetical protein